MYPRYKVFFTITLLCAVLTSSVYASVLKEALEDHLKDVAHKDSAESIKHDKQKGEKLHHLDSQINDDHKNHYSKANDEAKYLKKDYDSKTTNEADAYKGYNAQQDKAEDNESTGYKRGHKKGHHKQGFQNSYHKDESSNKSTYFDDFNDEGDRAVYNSRQNNHDNKGGRSYHGSHNNGQDSLRDNYHSGGYNRYGDTGNKHQTHQDYGKKYYLDDAINYNKYRTGHDTYDRGNVRDYHKYRAPEIHQEPDWQKWDNRRGWDHTDWQRDTDWRNDPRRERHPSWNTDYGGPGYYDDRGLRHDGGYGYGPQYGYGYGYGESRTAPIAEIPKNLPVVAQRKQTITIYEDPRYDGKDKGQLRREEGDYLQLEFKPSNQRYATVSYDDAYYNYSPAREEGVQASKTNRLVYNYKGQ